MWTVVYIAPSEHKANSLFGKMTEEGMLVRLRPLKGSLSAEVTSVEILVPETEAEEAMEFIRSILPQV